MTCLCALWLEFIKNVDLIPIEKTNIKKERLYSFLKYIEKHYNENISLDDLANSGNVSKSECLCVFKQCLNISPYQYLIDYRIHIATILLQDTDLSIGEVAASVGFEQFSNFSRVFKKKMNISPKEFRNKV